MNLQVLLDNDALHTWSPFSLPSSSLYVSGSCCLTTVVTIPTWRIYISIYMCAYRYRYKCGNHSHICMSTSFSELQLTVRCRIIPDNSVELGRENDSMHTFAIMYWRKLPKNQGCLFLIFLNDFFIMFLNIRLFGGSRNQHRPNLVPTAFPKAF